jgi:hypothetical protein
MKAKAMELYEAFTPDLILPDLEKYLSENWFGTRMTQIFSDFRW